MRIHGRVTRRKIDQVEQFADARGNFALVIGEPEALISRVLNGRRYLRPHERELWAQILGTDLSIFPDPPNFRRNNDIVPNYSPGGKVD